MSIHHYGYPQSVLFFDQADRIEALVREGILTYPCQMAFCSGTKTQALEQIERDPPDLLVAGVSFGRGDAVDLIKDLKRKNGLIPSIFMIQPEDIEIQKELYALGAFDVIHRPFPLPDLIKKIDRAVRVTVKPKRTRAESFVEYARLQEESVNRGMLVGDLIDLKSAELRPSGAKTTE